MTLRASKNLIDLDKLINAVWHGFPFRWARYSDAFSGDELPLELVHRFPKADFDRFERCKGGKKHRLLGKRLRRIEQSAGLPPIWRQFCSEAWSSSYRRAMENCAGISLADLQVEVTFWRHGPGDFIDPHLDNPDKVLIHLFYFSSRGWSPDDGGCLRILRSNQIQDVAEEISPRLGNSVMIVRSDRSWHGYTPILRQDTPRLAVQIVFHRSAMRYSIETATSNGVGTS